MSKYKVFAALLCILSGVSQAEDNWAQEYINQSPIHSAIKESMQELSFKLRLKEQLPALSDDQLDEVALLVKSTPANKLVYDASKMKLVGYYTETEAQWLAKKINTVVPLYTKKDRTGFTFYAAAITDGRSPMRFQDVLGVVTTGPNTRGTEARVGTIYIFKF